MVDLKLITNCVEKGWNVWICILFRSLIIFRLYQTIINYLYWVQTNIIFEIFPEDNIFYTLKQTKNILNIISISSLFWFYILLYWWVGHCSDVLCWDIMIFLMSLKVVVYLMIFYMISITILFKYSNKASAINWSATRKLGVE